MNTILTFLMFVISIWIRIWEARGDLVAAPVKFEGNDLCILGEFLTADDKVAIDEIQVEDLHYVPLATPAVNFPSGDPKAFVVAIKRSLLGSGAHRELETDFTLEFELGESTGLAKNCDLIVFEKLSDGVFADPFQLQRLKEQGALKKVHIYGDTDLERPARTSYPSVVEAHTALKRKEPSLVGAHPGNFQAKVSLPLHARYPHTAEESYFQLNITMPQVMVKCKSREGTSNRVQETCMHTFTDLPPQTLHWYIPAGSPLHSTLVDTVTTAAALIGVASVFLASKKSLLVKSPERTQVSLSS